jgi:hypothetical protein
MGWPASDCLRPLDPYVPTERSAIGLEFFRESARSVARGLSGGWMAARFWGKPVIASRVGQCITKRSFGNYPFLPSDCTRKRLHKNQRAASMGEPSGGMVWRLET